MSSNQGTIAEARVRSQSAAPQLLPTKDELGYEIDLLALVGIAWRGKWILLTCAMVFGSIGWLYLNFVATSFFTSTVRLDFQVRQGQVVDLESVFSGVSPDQPAINTELEIIKSRRVLQQLIDRLDLTNDTAFNGLAIPNPYSLRGLQWMISEWRTGEQPSITPPNEEIIQLRTMQALHDAIQVRPVRNTYVFDILVTTNDPRKSQHIANAIAKVYIEDQVQIKFEATEFAVNWLSERVSELEVDLERREREINSLRSASDLISLETLEALNLRLKELRDRLSSGRQSLVALEARLQLLNELTHGADPSQAVGILSDSTLALLVDRIAAGDRQAQSDFDAQIAALRIATLREQERTSAQQSALQQSFEELEAQIIVQETDAQRLSQMTRERDATAVLYETFLTRLKETSVQIGLQQADSSILSAAVPGVLVAPRSLLIQVLSIGIGLIVGLFILFLRQVMSSGFHTSNSLEAATGMPVLGQLPKLPVSQRHALTEYLITHPTSAGAEAVRNIRTSVLLSNVDTPAKVIMSTSSVPGEGKTTLSIALAYNLARMGGRVLLVEGDLRRRALNQYFNHANESTSLLSVLSGNATRDEASFHDTKLGLDVILGANSKVNAADVFSSDRFREFIEDARAHYDHVVVDTPPVLVVPDTRIMGQYADAIIYSVQWNHTNKAQVTQGLRELSLVGIKVAGLVLSQVDAKGMRRYGYGRYYGSYYSYGKGYYDLKE